MQVFWSWAGYCMLEFVSNAESVAGTVCFNARCVKTLKSDYVLTFFSWWFFERGSIANRNKYYVCCGFNTFTISM